MGRPGQRDRSARRGHSGGSGQVRVRIRGQGGLRPASFTDLALDQLDAQEIDHVRLRGRREGRVRVGRRQPLAPVGANRAVDARAEAAVAQQRGVAAHVPQLRRLHDRTAVGEHRGSHVVLLEVTVDPQARLAHGCGQALVDVLLSGEVMRHVQRQPERRLGILQHEPGAGHRVERRMAGRASNPARRQRPAEQIPPVLYRLLADAHPRHDVPVRMVRNGGGHEERGFGRDLADRHLVHDPVPVEIQGGGGGEVDMRDAGDTLDRLDPDVGEVGADDDPADVGDLTLRPVRERDVRAAGLHLRHEQLGGAGAEHRAGVGLTADLGTLGNRALQGVEAAGGRAVARLRAMQPAA